MLSSHQKYDTLEQYYQQILQEVAKAFGTELKLTRPKVSSMDLYRLTRQIYLCEKAFPGLTKGLRVYVYGLKRGKLEGVCLHSKVWTRFMSPEIRGFFERKSPLYKLMSRFGKGRPVIAIADVALEQTPAHEIGHLLSARISLQRWEAWEKVYSKYISSVGKTQRIFSMYSLSSPSEGFAEAFRGYVNEPDLLKRIWPDAWYYFESLRLSWTL